MPSASVAYADGPRSVNIVESSSATSTLATESFCMVRRCPELLDWLSAHPEAAMAPFTTETQLAQSLCVAAAACLARLRAPGAGHERRVQCRSVIYRSPDEGNYSHEGGEGDDVAPFHPGVPTDRTGLRWSARCG